MTNRPPDWQMPPGVNGGLWDYRHDADLAETYDQRLAGSPLLQLDVAFAEKHFQKPGRMLDLGCGTGRLLIPFARRGWSVLGVDLSEPMLNVVGAKARLAGVKVDRVQANIVQLECLADASFDHAACLFSTLGMVRGDEERRRVLSHVHRLLKADGTFVVHVHNWWFNVWDRDGRWWLMKDIFQTSARGDREMPAHLALTGLALHHFRRGEILHQLREAGFRLLEIQVVGLEGKHGLRCPWWFGWLRAYGYMIAVERVGPQKG
jgi:SAM-dependent methyltransferase